MLVVGKTLYLPPSTSPLASGFPIRHSASPLHMERGEEMFDYRSNDGVRLYCSHKERDENKKINGLWRESHLMFIHLSIS